MQPTILHYDPAKEYDTPERCSINEFCNRPEDSELSIAQARVKPGVTTQWHQLRGTTERYVITEGIGRVEIGDLPPTDVGVGDVVIIPAMCRQRITNTGDTDLVFLAICTPPFTHDVYIIAGD